MGRLAILLFVMAITVPACAAKRVTVEQLEWVLAKAHGKPDGKVAQQLAELALSERLSAAKLTRWEADLPGPASRQALIAAADASTFLDLPAAEIPTTPPPDAAARRRIVALAVDYTSKTMSRLPDLIATRDTIRFEDTPPRQRDTGSISDIGAALTPYQPLHPVSRSSVAVSYRDGREVVDSEEAKDHKGATMASGLTTWGEFGPILTTVLVDAAHGTMGWSHWEQNAAGPRAVFSYSVPKAQSHYEVNYCCVQVDNHTHIFKQLSGYHGEIAIDPSHGTILRLTVEADLEKDDPIIKADILVEYGPVVIGGATYICPLKSVSVFLAREQDNRAGQPRDFTSGMAEQNIQRSLQTLLDDIAFEQYHVFRAESRIVSGGSSDTSGTSAASSSVNTKGSAPSVPANIPTAIVTAESGAAVASAAPETTFKPDQPAASESTPTEISVAKLTELPESSTISQAISTNPSLTLHVTSRLVDVVVVAVDKKGRPVTGLKSEDFEIYDNGRKQAVQFFNEAGEEIAKEEKQELDQSVFSNRRAEIAAVKRGPEAVDGSTTILLIDAASLAWADLTYARAEILRFLRTLPANARVGLYVTNAHGFQVLEEATADHALLDSKLREWMPNAQDLAQAQQIEQRNRQEFDYVSHPSDLQDVNGNVPSGLSSIVVDPQLRENYSNPGRAGLTILIGVARHLAAIPGHKNLVWVTSDNMLADWTDKSVGSDKGSMHIDDFILRAQEALNDAHVSVYPLDASQLETNAIDPSLQNRNIELSPSVTAGPSAQGGGQAPGRINAEMQQNMHPIQTAVQKMAEATGGRVFRRSDDIARNLSAVETDSRAAYLLGFTPDTAADDQYHLLIVQLATRHGVTLRYRKGYEYAKEPTTLKERFQQAMWQSRDMSEIAITANSVSASEGATLKLNIATSDLALKEQNGHWADKLDVFLIQRDDGGLHARVTGQTLSLTLKPATYERMLKDGIPFDLFIEKLQDAGSVRVLVVDENSNRMGSVTIPSAAIVDRRR